MKVRMLFLLARKRFAGEASLTYFTPNYTARINLPGDYVVVSVRMPDTPSEKSNETATCARSMFKTYNIH